MPWSKNEIIAAKMAQKALSWNDPQYRLVLQNSGIRPWPNQYGKVSSTNPNADNASFVRFMAIAERSGYVDPKQGQGYWIGEAQKTCPRMHHKIRELCHQLQQIGVMNDPAAALAGFIQRQTQTRPQGPTNILMDLDWEWTYKVLEGLKGWLYRESKQRGVTLRDAVKRGDDGGIVPF